jgi:catechol 2,3-dioxygenase-like lactoylglutathione lyase family enzyme
MSPQIDVITLGVSDPARARRFYERGLGRPVRREAGDALSVATGSQASVIAVRPWEDVAADAGVSASSSGFRAFTLSCIFDTAQDVDAVLESTSRHGGTVSKPPKNALWGYSAYVTDPDGYLWKVASSKRRPLIGRADTNGRVIEPKELPLTIGVADMARAKQFYRDGLGLPVRKDYRKFVMFAGADGTSDLGMYSREALAADAAVAPAGTGFRGFALTHRADSREQVDALLARAATAGGEIVKPAAETRGGYGGYFSDLDGNLWNVASRA